MLVLLGSAVNAHAQLADRFTERWVRRDQSLYRPFAYTNGKDRDARASGSSWGASGALGAGVDTNIFESLDNERSSAIYDGILRFDHYRYVGDADRLRVTGIAPFRMHAASNNPDEFVGRLQTDWRHVSPGAMQFNIETEVKYENDDVVNTEGFSGRRDFEHVQFAFNPTFEYRFDSSRLIFRYRARYRDFVTTPGLPSLNFWFHGPGLEYRYDFSRRVSVSASYAFRQELYDENPARTASGALLANNPEEDNYFHRGRVETRLRPWPSVDVIAAYEFERKDDRFDDFESYDDHVLWTQTRWFVLPDLELALTFAYQARDFDNRPAGGDRTLEFDRYYVSPSVRYILNERFTLFAYHVFNDRDTNRNFGNSFRDFEINRFIGGVSFAF